MFTGSIVALVTPMDEKGNVCRSSMKKLIDYHVANGTSAIVSVGTTGESATLSHEEHGDVVMLTLELADGRIPVIAGTGRVSAGSNHSERKERSSCRKLRLSAGIFILTISISQLE